MNYLNHYNLVIITENLEIKYNMIIMEKKLIEFIPKQKKFII